MTFYTVFVHSNSIRFFHQARYETFERKSTKSQRDPELPVSLSRSLASPACLAQSRVCVVQPQGVAPAVSAVVH